MQLDKEWILVRKVTGKNREILRITLLAAGFRVYNDELEFHNAIDMFPLICFDEEGDVVECQRGKVEKAGWQRVTYKELMEALRNRIKNGKRGNRLNQPR